jgi:hypothetical protein
MSAQIEFAPPMKREFSSSPITGQETLAVAFDPTEHTLADQPVQTGQKDEPDFFEHSIAGRLIGGAIFSVAMLCYLVVYTAKVSVCLLFRSRAERFA